MVQNYFDPALVPYIQIGGETNPPGKMGAPLDPTVKPGFRLDANGMVSNNPVVNYLNQQSLLTRPGFGLSDAAEGIAKVGHGMQEPQLDSLPIVNKARSVAGTVMAAPYDLAKAGVDKMAPTIKQIGDSVTKTEGQIRAEELANKVSADEAAARADAQAKSANAMGSIPQDTDVANTIFGALGNSQAGPAVPVGPARTDFGDYKIPEPQAPGDFSQVQDIIDKTKPQDPNVDYQNQRKGAIVAGLIGGLLSRSQDSNASFGQILGAGGLGVLSGMAEADKAQNESKEKFKAAMDDYWIRTAGVKKAELESQQQYVERVYQTKLKQLEINSAAAEAKAKAGESQLLQSGDKFFVKSVVNGQQMLRPLDMGLIDRGSGMIKNMTAMLGGDDTAKKQAESIYANIVTTKDPTYALPIFTIAKLKDNGKYLDVVNHLSATLPAFKNQWNAVGQELTGNPTIKTEDAQALSQKRRDAILMDLFLKSTEVRKLMYSNAGLGGGTK